MIIAVGYRVRSTRGTQFRQWATRILGEYMLKGFAMDDERLKDPKWDYFDELLDRIRKIRSSELRFYQPGHAGWSYFPTQLFLILNLSARL